jgi:hypothetical protein
MSGSLFDVYIGLEFLTLRRLEMGEKVNPSASVTPSDYIFDTVFYRLC